jgi:hypothetical protein
MQPDHAATKTFIDCVFAKSAEDRGTIEATGFSEIVNDGMYQQTEYIYTGNFLTYFSTK